MTSKIRMRMVLLTCALAMMSVGGSEPPPCECEPTVSPAQAFERADLVFFGRPSDFYYGAGANREWHQYWEFDVEGVWKGPAQPHLRIYASGSEGPGSCDGYFKVGERYLVYAYLEEKIPNRYLVSGCSRTTIAERSLRDLGFLGKPSHIFSE